MSEEKGLIYKPANEFLPTQMGLCREKLKAVEDFVKEHGYDKIPAVNYMETKGGLAIVGGHHRIYKYYEKGIDVKAKPYNQHDELRSQLLNEGIDEKTIDSILFVDDSNKVEEIKNRLSIMKELESYTIRDVGSIMFETARQLKDYNNNIYDSFLLNQN